MSRFSSGITTTDLGGEAEVYVNGKAHVQETNGDDDVVPDGDHAIGAGSPGVSSTENMDEDDCHRYNVHHEGPHCEDGGGAIGGAEAVL
jgi:hypothetical protein